MISDKHKYNHSKTSSRGGGGYRGGGGGYDRRDHGGYRGSGGHDRYRRSPSPYHRRDDYRRRSRSRSYSPRKYNIFETDLNYV